MFITRERLRAAKQQVWRSIKEVKVESLGENIFIFRFASEGEKKRILHRGPWHFNNSLMVLTEPTGVGNIKQQNFTHTLFWVQLHNAPIMCMDKDIMREIGEKIGKVEEVETDETGECLGSFARLRNLIDITQPLKKRVLLKLEDGERISIRIAYEKLPDFCFCCGIIGHQYKECLEYKGQPKDELIYGAWMKAQTKVERAKQKTDQEFRYKKQKASQSASGNHEQQEQTQSKKGQERPTVIDGSGATQRQDDRSTGPIKISHVEGLVEGSLMKQGRADKQQTIGCSSVAE
ncbi:hypothetical protein KPL71_001599 [Citrus sinensis]|uniref:Uncharacterized protein n=1 Tax=Citrus sinensis TaxID=2711 RepID=A0ACB8NXV2_CITSI|nr:hypothetical protein KPL71_001599 [Citrus sinensis]